MEYFYRRYTVIVFDILWRYCQWIDKKYDADV